MDKNKALIQMSESDKVALWKQDFAEQSTHQKVFSAIWAVESEVNNGGFSQFFANSSCETAAFVAEALDIIGAARTAEICKRAIKTAFPLGLPSDVDAISTAARNFPPNIEEALENLDDEFMAYPHNLTDLLFAYVSNHPEEFGPVG